MAEVRVSVYGDWKCKRCGTVVHNPKAEWLDKRWDHTTLRVGRDGKVYESTCAARASEGEWIDRLHAFLMVCPSVPSRHDRTGDLQGAVVA